MIKNFENFIKSINESNQKDDMKLKKFMSYMMGDDSLEGEFAGKGICAITKDINKDAEFILNATLRSDIVLNLDSLTYEDVKMLTDRCKNKTVLFRDIFKADPSVISLVKKVFDETKKVMLLTTKEDLDNYDEKHLDVIKNRFEFIEI